MTTCPASEAIVTYTASTVTAYTGFVKRLQIYIEEEVDQALGAEARRKHTSKAALIREYVADRLPVRRLDPVDAFIGSFDGGPNLSTSVDDVVYGSRG